MDKALALLELFSFRDRVRITDASRRLGVSEATTHRLMQVLRRHGYVRQDPTSREYLAGTKLVKIGLAVVASSSDLRRRAHPWIERLVADVRETVQLVELRGDAVVFLDSVETSTPLRVGARTGHQIPAHATAAGKVLLAALTAVEVDMILPDEQLRSMTARTQTSREALKAELTKVRRQGYATNFRESEPEVHAVAVPVLDQHGVTQAALAITAPAARMRVADVPGLARQATQAATRITQALHP